MRGTHAYRGTSQWWTLAPRAPAEDLDAPKELMDGLHDRRKWWTPNHHQMGSLSSNILNTILSWPPTQPMIFTGPCHCFTLLTNPKMLAKPQSMWVKRLFVGRISVGALKHDLFLLLRPANLRFAIKSRVDSRIHHLVVGRIQDFQL